MRKAYTQLNIAVFLWGFTGILGKAIHLAAPVLVWWRMFLASLTLFILLKLGKKFVKVKKRDYYKLFFVGILFAVHWVFFYYSVKWANASVAMICMATSSVLASVLEPVIRKRPLVISEFLFGLLALLGVMCIYFFPGEAKESSIEMPHFEKGVLVGVLAAMVNAFFSILNKPLAEKYPAQLLVFYEMTSGWVILLFFLLFSGYTITENLGYIPSGMDWLWLGILVYFCTVIAQSLATAALQKLSAFTVTLSVNLEPIYGIFFAFLFFNENEQLGNGFYLGLIIIFLSLLGQLYFSTQKSRRNVPKSPLRERFRKRISQK